MIRKLLSLLFAVILLVFASTVNAQTATTGSAQTTAENSTSKLKQQVQLLQEQRKTAVTQARDDAKAMIQTKREEFKTRIQTIRDQKKKVLVQRIDAKLAKINEKHTSKFSEVLTRLQGFLDKIKQSTADTKVLGDAAAAQIAIDTAKTAVDIQADKAYTMVITDDIALKLNAGTTVSQLRQDLTAVHKLIVDAKQAVQKLNMDRKLIKKEASKSAEL